jgi:hypothetical protein
MPREPEAPLVCFLRLLCHSPRFKLLLGALPVASALKEAADSESQLAKHSGIANLKVLASGLP